MYTITHHYLTMDDDGATVVETESVTVAEPFLASETVREMIEHPGGRSGTTISLTVGLVGTTTF